MLCGCCFLDNYLKDILTFVYYGSTVNKFVNNRPNEFPDTTVSIVKP